MSGAGRGRNVASSPVAATSTPRAMTTHLATSVLASVPGPVPGSVRGSAAVSRGVSAGTAEVSLDDGDMAAVTPDGERLRLMAVHAHPDDESSKGAATMARYAREGADVVVVTCTGGERGDILNPAMDRPEVRADLPGIRRRELVTAVNILGVRQLDLGFVDSGFPEAPAGQQPPPLDPGCFALAPLEAAGRALVELVRRE